MKHYPVMLPEVLSALAIQANETCVDGTFGNGGYSEAILNSANCSVIGLRQRPKCDAARERVRNLSLIHI